MFEFEEINKLFSKAKSLDEGRAWIFVIDSGVQRKIIELNTTDQLGREGIDSEGDSLGDYAPLTVEIRSNGNDPRNKAGRSLQTDHIDFKVTGDYWDSWKVQVTSTQIIVTTDPNRYNELVNELRFSPEHVGLTEENLEVIRKIVLPKYQEYARRELFS